MGPAIRFPGKAVSQIPGFRGSSARDVYGGMAAYAYRNGTRDEADKHQTKVRQPSIINHAEGGEFHRAFKVCRAEPSRTRHRACRKSAGPSVLYALRTVG